MLQILGQALLLASRMEDRTPRPPAPGRLPGDTAGAAPRSGPRNWLLLPGRGA
jgi:hypothetical protein